MCGLFHIRKIGMRPGIRPEDWALLSAAQVVAV